MTALANPDMPESARAPITMALQRLLPEDSKIMQLPDGSILVSDDGGKKIWRIYYKG